MQLATAWLSLKQLSFLAVMKRTRDRAAPDFDGPSPASLVLDNPYTPENVLVRQALDASPILNELLVSQSVLPPLILYLWCFRFTACSKLAATHRTHATNARTSKRVLEIHETRACSSSPLNI